VIRAARQVNDSQPPFAAALVQRALGSLKGKRIAALGLAFKPDVDDLRESPAIEVVHLLLKAGAQVTIYEPFKTDFTIASALTAATLSDAVADVDAMVLLVGHSQLNALDPAEVAKISSARVAVDTVNGWQPAAWQAAGFDIYRLGVGTEHES
jgi:UDP-N-acetyl-D-mannosaminuronate dehydrogenase